MTDLRHAPDAPPAADRPAELGFPPMDRIHAEFEQLLMRRPAGSDDEWLPLLSEIDAHLRSHFEAEDRWMTETAFPPRDCHMEEHAAVLRSSQEVLDLARQGRFDAAPSFVDALARWFPGHADYLDSALAAWLCKQRFGGKPIVVHRPERREAPRP
nr:hemerythrin domain-containing protein [Xenophilus azovorans]